MRTSPVVPAEGRPSRVVIAIPIIVIAVWWALCLATWALGFPIPYVRVNFVPVLLLVGACIVAAVLGFFAVARGLTDAVDAQPPSARLVTPVLIGVVAMVVLLVPWAEFYSGYHLWELGYAVGDQGAAFAAAAKRVTEGTTSRLGIVGAQALLAPFTLTVVPVAALAWFERRRHILPLIVAVSVLGSMTLLVGRAYYVTTAAMLVLAAWVLSRVRRRMAPTWRTAAFFVVSPLLFIVVFSAGKLSRGGSLVPLCPAGVRECTATRPPTPWESVTTYLATYASQSMEGLGRALEGDWAFGGGYRHSPALTGMAENVGVPQTRVITDQLQAHGWSDAIYWSTGWAWIANDVPWFAVPIVVAVLAGFLGLTWRRAVQRADWLSVALFCQGWMALFFQAQNNMLAVDGPAYVGFLALCAVFVAREILRYRRRPRDGPDGTAVSAEGGAVGAGSP